MANIQWGQTSEQIEQQIDQATVRRSRPLQYEAQHRLPPDNTFMCVPYAMNQALRSVAPGDYTDLDPVHMYASLSAEPGFTDPTTRYLNMKRVCEAIEGGRYDYSGSRRAVNLRGSNKLDDWLSTIDQHGYVVGRYAQHAAIVTGYAKGRDGKLYFLVHRPETETPGIEEYVPAERFMSLSPHDGNEEYYGIQIVNTNPLTQQRIQIGQRR